MRSLLAILFACGIAAGAEFPPGSKLAEIRVMDHGSPAVVNFADSKATAVVFVSTNCPVSNAYNERMNAVYTDYQARGVRFAFVNANVNESVAEIDEHARAKNFRFKVYKDVDNVLADKLNAQFTPEVFLFDNTGTLVYHGRIDDTRETANVKSQDFRAALDAALAGRPVPVANTKAFGCTIRRGKQAS
jgi:thiol-disulfide isomerase/thioredoxin